MIGHLVLGGCVYVAHGPRDLREEGVDWAGLRLIAWVVGAEVVFGILIFPATLTEGRELDYTWFGVVPFTVVVLGGGASLLAFLVGMLVVTPGRMIVRGLTSDPGDDPRSVQAILLGLIVLWIIPVGVALALGIGQSVRDAGGVLGVTAYLIGVRRGVQPTWLWVARAGIVVIVVLVVLVRRLTRRHPGLARPLRTARGDRERTSGRETRAKT